MQLGKYEFFTVSDIENIIKDSDDILNYRDDDNNNILHICCQHGTLDILKFILNIIEYDHLHEINKYGNDIYLCSVIGGKIEIMKYLEDSLEWDINSTNLDENNSYLLASYHGEIEIMKHIENTHDFDLYHKNIDGNDAYLMAVSNGKINVIEHLENIHDWDTYVENNYEENAYIVASYNGKIQVIEHLHRRDPDMCEYSIDCHKNGMYSAASRGGQSETIIYLRDILKVDCL